ncbi:18092_t:CDS:2, partial [Gigaspora margarita]
MKCKKCQIDKLSEEFPFGTISLKCEHVSSWCLKCLVIYLKENQRQCPICKVELTNQEFNDYCLLWDNSNFKINLESFSPTHTKLSGPTTNSGIFYVVRLNGEKFELKLSEISTVKELRHKLMHYTKINVNKLMLVYKNMELKPYSTYCLTLFYNERTSFKNLVFDLYWGYPKSGRDYLDGTCLIYKGNTLWKAYDYKAKVHLDVSYISHSGDLMNDSDATGHHKVLAKLDNLPND